MARRWRIRHKLLLGLASAIAILALLLAGTLNGMWSYYITMKTIESKLKELDAAERFKIELAQLSLYLPDKAGDSFPQQVEKIRFHIKAARKKLLEPTGDPDNYAVKEAVEATLSRELTSDDGDHLLDTIACVEKQLTELEGLCHAPALNSGATTGGTEDARIAWNRQLAQIQGKVKEIDRTSNDIREPIRTDLRNRIAKSKHNYQFTLPFLVAVSVLGLVLMLSALRFFYGWIFNPVRDLQQGVGRVAQGDFEHRIEVHSGDEMEELASAFNDMTCRLRDLYRDMARQINERSRQLVRSERLASVGFLAAGVAHEINNPLASIAFCSEALEARLGEMQDALRLSGRGRKDFEVFAKYLKMIQDEAFRCKNITERLLEFSRGGERKRERTDLAQLVQSVLDVTQHLQNSKGKEIVFRPRGAVFAWVSAEEIKSVVLNLVVNALDSMDEGGRLTIGLAARDGQAELAFSDTGCGMTAEVLENIFEPFFTRNRSGKGTGLGLTITHRVVSQHGGEIEAASPGEGKGSTFRVRLPLQAPAEGATHGTGTAGKEEGLGHAAA